MLAPVNEESKNTLFKYLMLGITTFMFLRTTYLELTKSNPEPVHTISAPPAASITTVSSTNGGVVSSPAIIVVGQKPTALSSAYPTAVPSAYPTTPTPFPTANPTPLPPAIPSLYPTTPTPFPTPSPTFKHKWEEEEFGNLRKPTQSR